VPQENEREPERNLVIILYHKIATSNMFGVGCFFFGWLVRFLTVRSLIWINKATADIPEWVSVIYLLLERPLFVIGATLAILPFLLRTPILSPLAKLMASRVWYPIARLTYGAYLIHGTVMLFRAYNHPQGVFASEFDAFLFFFAYVAFAFFWSFLMTLMIEMPILKMVNVFIIRQKGSVFSNLRSSIQNYKSDKGDTRQDLLLDNDED